MNTLSATYRVVTPMFMSGANNESQAELRLPSIKGALRFWWRALAWGRLNGDLADIRREEAELFGSADQKVGQAKVLMRLVVPSPPKAVGSKNKTFSRLSGAQYLGYGVMNFRGELSRPCYLEPFEFQIEAVYKPSMSAPQRDSFVQALKALGLFGALGSKSRKGYGSLALTKLSVDNKAIHNQDDKVIYKQPTSSDELVTQIQAVIGQRSQPQPSYSAFSAQSSVYILAKGQDSVALLDSVGRAMQRYRSYGRNGKVNGKDAEQNFDDDHDLVLSSATRNVSSHPRRVVFGLPHNYYFSSNGLKVDVEPVGEGLNHRASPLFLHIHEIACGTKVAVAILLPAQFLPSHEGIKLKAKNGRTSYAPVNVDYGVIRGWLDQHYFPDIQPVVSP